MKRARLALAAWASVLVWGCADLAAIPSPGPPPVAAEGRNTGLPVPEICLGRTTCFMAFDGADRGFCQAYVEGATCFMAFNDRVDRGWCQVIREGTSCQMALDGDARTACEAGKFPRRHRHWAQLCPPPR